MWPPLIPSLTCDLHSDNPKYNTSVTNITLGAWHPKYNMSATDMTLGVSQSL